MTNHVYEVKSAPYRFNLPVTAHLPLYCALPSHIIFPACQPLRWRVDRLRWRALCAHEHLHVQTHIHTVWSWEIDLISVNIDKWTISEVITHYYFSVKQPSLFNRQDYLYWEGSILYWCSEGRGSHPSVCKHKKLPQSGSPSPSKHLPVFHLLWNFIPCIVSQSLFQLVNTKSLCQQYCLYGFHAPCHNCVSQFLICVVMLPLVLQYL